MGEPNVSAEFNSIPRISKLAVAGALGLPAALVAGLIAAGLGMIVAPNIPGRDDTIATAAALLGLSVLLAGVTLSICGLAAICRSNGRLGGRRLAHFGIWLPPALVIGFAALAAWRWEARLGELAALARPDGRVAVEPPGRTKAEQPPSFRTAAVTRGEVVETVDATGTLEPQDLVDVGAQVTGQIVKFGDDPHHPGKPIDYCSQVEKGTILAFINDAPYRVLCQQATADYERAQAEVALAKAKAKGENSEVAKASLAAAEADVSKARAALEQARADLEATTIRSPCTGFIISRRANVGQTMGADPNALSLFLIAKDLKQMQIWAQVNEADIGQIKQGMEAAFTCDTFPKERFHGKVVQIRLNAQNTQNVVSYTVVIGVDNRDLKLLPYLTADVHLVVEKRPNCLRVPNRALRWKPQPEQISSQPPPSGKPASGGRRGHFWVLEPDGRHVRRVSVAIGLSDGTTTEVSGPDVKEGMEVVVGDDADAPNPFLPQLVRPRPSRGDGG
jgi:HlyD family secretion protein